MTRAEKGGTYYHRGQPYSYETPHPQEVNTTGAGDVFAAAVLASASLLHNDMRAVCTVAAMLGATAITRPWLEGAPTADEVRQALAMVQQA